MSALGYELAGSNSPQGLKVIVQEMLADGWRLYGNPYSIHLGTHAGWSHYQAMIRDYP